MDEAGCRTCARMDSLLAGAHNVCLGALRVQGTCVLARCTFRTSLEATKPEEIGGATLKLAIKEEEKVGGRGKDRCPGIILRRGRNMVLDEKIPQSWPLSLAGCHRPLCNGL
jgi:hypothetical protein